MNTSLLLQNTTNWQQFFFHDPFPEDLSEVLPVFLKQRSQTFIETVPYSFTEAQTQEFNAWYWSSEGQEVLRLACDALWNQMSIHAQKAQPAHDARHAMYKVPSAALAYIHAEQVDGWERVGVLGALLHDHGRWPEERIYGEPLQSQLHAQISFVLGQEWLEPFDMPTPVKQHILLSAIDSFISALKAHPQHTPLSYTSTDVDDWLETARAFANSHAHTQRTLADEIDILLSAPNIAPGENYRQRVFNKMHYSPESDKQRSMAAALAWTTQSRLALDSVEAKELQLMAGVFADDLLITCLLGKLDTGVAVICSLRKSIV